MTTLKDFMNDMLIDYEEARENGSDSETERLRLLDEYLVKINKYLIGE